MICLRFHQAQSDGQWFICPVVWFGKNTWQTIIPISPNCSYSQCMLFAVIIAVVLLWCVVLQCNMLISDGEHGKTLYLLKRSMMALLF